MPYSKYPNLATQILSLLKPYPEFMTIAEMGEILNVAYLTIYFRLMELLADRKIGCYKKSGIKLFFAPYESLPDKIQTMELQINH